MLSLEPSPARDFLAGLGNSLPRPRAILVVSAHHDAAYEGDCLTVTASPNPPTIHDFRGFPDALYALRYPAPGDPALAQRIADLLGKSGIAVELSADRGLDHGAWVPLSLVYPASDIPVVQLAIASSQTPEWHYALGQSLAPLRDEGVLIVGSGSMTHNLRAFFTAPQPIDATAAAWVTAFADWMADNIAAAAIDDVLHAVERAPHGRDNHPTMDHILPLFVAIGAGGGDRSRRLHRSTTYGILAMDVYAFG